MPPETEDALSKDEWKPRRNSRKWWQERANEPREKTCVGRTHEGGPYDFPFGNTEDVFWWLDDDVLEDQETAKKYNWDREHNNQRPCVDVIADISFIDMMRRWRYWRWATVHRVFDSHALIIPKITRNSVLGFNRHYLLLYPSFMQQLPQLVSGSAFLWFASIYSWSFPLKELPNWPLWYVLH